MALLGLLAVNCVDKISGPGPVSAVQSTVTAAPMSIAADGSTSTITVTAKDANGNPISGATVVLVATGIGNTLTQVGTANASGVATGTLSSTAVEAKTISATIDGVAVAQTVTVTVTPGPVTAITVTPAPVTIGDTVRLAGSARDAHGNSISGVSFTWTTSDLAVATVSSTGLVTAVAIGTATITATAPNSVSGTATATVAGRAMRFNGSTQYAQITQDASFNASVITVEAWIRLSASITETYAQARIVNRQDASDGNKSWGLEVFGVYPGVTTLGNQLNFHANTGSGGADVHSPAALTVGRWYHVAGTCDGVTTRLYIDGQQVAQVAAAGPVYGPINSDIIIGRTAPWSEFYFPGDIDEVRVWNVVRSQQQISDNRYTVLPSGTSGLVGYWRFDENSGSTTADRSGGGHPATLVNAPTRVNEGWRP